MAKKRKPKIGITTSGTNPDERFDLPKEYVHAVEMAGGIPYLLPPTNLRAEEVMPGLDGILFSGGGDIHPAIYGGKHHETIYNVDSKRDTFELELAKYVVKNDIPCLAICRGCQIINVAQGGTLHEHLPDAYGEKILHRTMPRKPVLHDIKLAEKSLMTEVLGQKEVITSSWHHQCIKKLGKDIVAVGHTADKVIEAVEMPKHRWLLGIQWHPEHTIDEDPVQLELFKGLITAAYGKPKGTRK